MHAESPKFPKCSGVPTIDVSADGRACILDNDETASIRDCDYADDIG